jgi:pyrroloquinoline quinone biosynthesis protein B
MWSRFLLFSLFISICSCTGAHEQPKHDASKPALDNVPYMQVIGIAQDGGYPQAGCEKTCCRRVWDGNASMKHVSSLALVNPQTKQYWMLDATPDFKAQLHELQRIAPLPTGIFLTHGHIGHYTGLMNLGREAIGTKDVRVYAMPRMVQLLTNHAPWSQLVSLQNIALQPIHADEAVSLDATLRVTPFLVPHRDEFTETVGFKVQSASQTLIFIPDIDKWEKWGTNLKEVIQHSDAVFIDGTFYDGDELPGRNMREIPHPFVVETMAMLKDLPISEKQKVHFIHLNHTNPLLDARSEARKTVLAQGFQIAEEGDKIELN